MQYRLQRSTTNAGFRFTSQDFPEFSYDDVDARGVIARGGPTMEQVISNRMRNGQHVPEPCPLLWENDARNKHYHEPDQTSYSAMNWIIFPPGHRDLYVTVRPERIWLHNLMWQLGVDINQLIQRVRAINPTGDLQRALYFPIWSSLDSNVLEVAFSALGQPLNYAARGCIWVDRNGAPLKRGDRIEIFAEPILGVYDVFEDNLGRLIAKNQKIPNLQLSAVNGQIILKL